MLVWVWVKQANIQIDMANGARILIELGEAKRIHRIPSSQLGNALVENAGNCRLVAREQWPVRIANFADRIADFT